MKRYIAFLFAFVYVLSLVGCASKSDGTTSSYHSFEFENVSKLVVISVDGKRFEVTDTDTVQQITDNIESIQFEKGESSENTNGFGPFIQWYGANDNLIESISVMGEETIIYDGFFWTATDGNIDEAILNEILRNINQVDTGENTDIPKEEMEAKETDDTSLLSRLKDRVIETVLENDEMGGAITASDVVMDQTIYGSFSDSETEEMLVICKILNMPHVGGLDRRAIIILGIDSMDVVAYTEIPADEVWVDTLPMSNGQDRIIFSGKSTYQGISAQDVMYFCIQDGQWTETPVGELEVYGEDCFYYLTEDMMIVTSETELTGPSDITAILMWDRHAGEFIVLDQNLAEMASSEPEGKPTQSADNTGTPKDGTIQDGKIYFEGFGWIDYEGGGTEGIYAEDIYENGNTIGSMD